MALDLYLQKDMTPPKTADNRFLSFEDDGYFWFLYHPFFEELNKQSAQIIDPSDDAFFEGESLDLLSRTVERAKKAISQQSDIWEEFIGTIVEKSNGTKVIKRYSTVHRKELESILTKLENAVNEAKDKHIGILFFGD